jgi:hypothetical protein
MLTAADRRPVTLKHLLQDCGAHPSTAAPSRNGDAPPINTILRGARNTTLDAVTTIRDTIAHAENNKLPMCVLTLDFKHAFDRISHSYLFTIHCSYGLSAQFIHLIGNLYNGHLYGTIPIRCCVRQGCPLSMALYALCLQPFLNMLEQRLPGVGIGWRDGPVSVVAHADDVTVFIMSVADFTAVEDDTRHFEKASGARLNSQESKALQTRRWNTLTLSSELRITLTGGF